MLIDWLKEAVTRNARLQLCVGQSPLFCRRGRVEASPSPKVTREDLSKILEQGREWGLPVEGEKSVGIPGFGRCHVSVQAPWMLFRPLPADQPPDLEKLHLPPVLAELAQLPQGLVLLGGQRGSGLRTTVASLLELLRQGEPRRMLTVGRCHDYVQAHGRGLVGSCRELTEALRDSCDGVVLWVTDSASAQAAVQAAEEGLLVFALMRGLHTPNLLDRLRQWLADTQRLGDALRAAYYQRLLPSGQGLLPICEFVSGDVCRQLLYRAGPDRIYPECLEGQTGCWSLLHSLQDWLEQEQISPLDADRVIQTWS
jgi:twitching motility protein PilT